MEKEFRVSHSKIKTWRRCHKQYSYKYIEKIEPRRKARPLVFGSIIHEMIEAHANGDDPQNVIKKYEGDSKKLFSVEREDYLQIVKDADSLMKHYFEYYKKDKLKFVVLKKKSAEHEFEVEIAKGIVLNGKIDAIVRTEDSRTWLTEHKSHKEVPSEDVRFRDLQTAIYVNMLPTLGITNIDGVMWDYIRSKPPSIPEMTKKGKLSKAKIDTFKSIYEKAIKDNKLDPREYEDILKELENSADNYFKRIFMPINSSMAAELMQETIITAEEMRERGYKDHTRNITRDCTWCSYESLCRAELVGSDADYLRKTEFRERKKDEKEPRPVD